MKVRKFFFVLVLVVTIFVLIVVNVGGSLCFYLDDDGNIITSSFNGEIPLGGGEFVLSDKTYSNSRSDGNVFWITGGNFTFNRPVINKSGDSDTVTSLFDGTNASVFMEVDGVLTIHDGTSVTDGVYAHAFYIDSASLFIDGMNISTKGNFSSSLVSFHGGKIDGASLDLSVLGEDSHAVVVSGDGSEVSLRHSLMSSLLSSVVYLENGASSSFDNSEFQCNGDSDNVVFHSVDSNQVTTFSSSSSSFITGGGNTFVVDGGKAEINLISNSFINRGGNFLKVGGDGESSLSDVKVMLKNQGISGNILVYPNSLLELDFSSSSYEGVINSFSGEGDVSIHLGTDSRIKLMGDMYLSSFDDDDDTYSNVDFNGYDLYVGGEKVEKEVSLDDEGEKKDEVIDNFSSSLEEEVSKFNNNSSSEVSNSNGNSSSNTITDDNILKQDDSLNNGSDSSFITGELDNDKDDIVSDKDFSSDVSNYREASISIFDDRTVMIVNIIGSVLIVMSVISLFRLYYLKNIEKMEKSN